MLKFSSLDRVEPLAGGLPTGAQIRNREQFLCGWARAGGGEEIQLTPTVTQAALRLTQSRKQHHPLVRASRPHTVRAPQPGPVTPTDTRSTAADLTHTPVRPPVARRLSSLPAATPSLQVTGADAPRHDCAPGEPNRSPRDAQWQQQRGNARGLKGRAQGLLGALRARTHCAGAAGPRRGGGVELCI